MGRGAADAAPVEPWDMASDPAPELADET
jgi:hypothetical protein